jgi:hypothetical protein
VGLSPISFLLDAPPYLFGGATPSSASNKEKPSKGSEVIEPVGGFPVNDFKSSL